MTRKDYKIIAEALGEYLSELILNGDDIIECNKKYQHHKDRVERIFSYRLRKDNDRFDATIFSNYMQKVVDEIVAH